MDVDASWVRAQRLRAQGLTLPTDRTPTEAVRLLAAVQSQEPAHAFWSLALRSDATTEGQVRAAYDAGEHVRTHVLRPTWHLVAADDVRWLLATTAGRVHQANAPMARRRGLTPADLDRGAEVLADALSGGAVMVRAELAAVLAAAGLPTGQLDVVLLVMHAELEQVVVSGPMRGASHTYALFDDRVPRGPADAADPTRLVRRFLTGHGPAGARDVARWSSLTLTTVRAAIAALRDQVGDEVGVDLAEVEVSGETTPGSPRDPTARRRRSCSCRSSTSCRSPTATSPSRRRRGTRARPGPTSSSAASSAATPTSAPGGARSAARRRSRVALDLAPGVSADLRAAAEAEAQRLATFLGRDLALRGRDGA